MKRRKNTLSQTGFYKVYISCIGRDGGEGVTKGYLLAKHLYRMLEQKGIHTFLMGRCNPDDRTGALDSAAVLVVVGASAAELTSDAVRNDYEDYIAGVELSGKRMWRVFNYSRGMSKGDLPDYLRLHRLYDHLDTDELVAKIEETLPKKPPRWASRFIPSVSVPAKACPYRSRTRTAGASIRRTCKATS